MVCRFEYVVSKYSLFKIPTFTGAGCVVESESRLTLANGLQTGIENADGETNGVTDAAAGSQKVLAGARRRVHTFL